VDLMPLLQRSIFDVAIDATGLKVYGEGEWKVRRHGTSKRRTWRKLHVVVNTQNGQVEALALTPNSTDDAEVAAPQVEEVLQQHPLHRLFGDGAYDKVKVWRPLHGRSLRLVFPPSRRAVKNRETEGWHQARNKMLDTIAQVGRPAWKKAAGYHKRSLAETTMFRYKTIIGGRLRNRKEANQRTEARVSCRLLNCLLQLAKPTSYKIT
jgi:Transposase DDE domain